MLHLFTQFAQNSYSYSYSSDSSGTGSVLLNIVLILIGLAVIALLFTSMWRVFTKAGKPGWAAFVPIYNSYVMLKITGKPSWWLVWFFIPIADIIVGLIVSSILVRCFGKGTGFFILLIFLPWVAYPILAFGDAAYRAPEPTEGNDTGSSAKPDGSAEPGGTAGNPAPPKLIS